MTETSATPLVAPDESTVLVSVPAPGIRLITLNRPARLNAITPGLVDELLAAIADVAADRECRVVILTGTGRAFSAGMDLNKMPAHEDGGWDTPQVRLARQKHIVSVVFALRALPVPVIAAVNGAAVGGGFAWALASDIRVVARTARFSAAFVRLGISGCDIGVSWLLPRLIGASRAFELMLTGRIIDAEEADRAGLVSAVVEQDELMETALERARLVVRNSPYGVALTKEVMWNQLEIGSLAAGVELENRTQVLATYSEDYVEASTAFVQKRDPTFHNR